MTGTPLLIGQVLTALVFIGIGLGLVLWLFRADGPRPTLPPAAPPAEPQPGPAAEPGRTVRLRPAPPAEPGEHRPGGS